MSKQTPKSTDCQNIAIIAPTTERSTKTYGERHNWNPLRDMLAGSEPMTWFRVPLNEMPGDTTTRKQTKVLNIMSRTFGRGAVQTLTEDGYIFLRRLGGTL